MPRAAVSLGSNCGDRAGHIARALESLRRNRRIRGLRVSRLYETDPMGGPPQRPFFNAAAIFETDLSPQALLACFQEIERREGRRRGPRFGPRTVDLDLLLYGGEAIERGGLRVPHRRMLGRRFVLEPLAEIAADWVFPKRFETIAELAWRSKASRR